MWVNDVAIVGWARVGNNGVIISVKEFILSGPGLLPFPRIYKQEEEKTTTTTTTKTTTTTTTTTTITTATALNYTPSPKEEWIKVI